MEMGKSSEPGKRFKAIQGGKVSLVKPAKLLTHKDIKEFFARFAEAIWVNQKRVDKLLHRTFHRHYDDSRWRSDREDYLSVIVDLSMTVDKMPERLLKRLTELAVNHRPEAVRWPLFNAIGVLAPCGADPGLHSTASRFFSDLIAVVIREEPNGSPIGDPIDISLWFEYDDPISITRDSECEYGDLLASHIEKESAKTKRALAIGGRLKFYKSRYLKEYGDYRARHIEFLKVERSL
jgi:hypothetical protein